jgi:hypothetical protein
MISNALHRTTELPKTGIQERPPLPPSPPLPLGGFYFVGGARPRCEICRGERWGVFDRYSAPYRRRYKCLEGAQAIQDTIWRTRQRWPDVRASAMQPSVTTSGGAR